MGIENFIREALRQPHDYIAYHVGRELAELHPGKTIVEGQNWYFDLEAFVRADQCSIVESESLAYIAKWNEDLQPELRVSARGAAGVVRATEGFSFAYLKELFVASMVQWMSSGGRGSMDGVILAQAKMLREQMNSAASAASA